MSDSSGEGYHSAGIRKGNGLRTAPDMMKMKNLEREMDMRTMKKEQNEFAMNVFGLHKNLQDDNGCTDDCFQEVFAFVDDWVDYDEDYLDSADCDNTEMCAYRTQGAMFACGTYDWNQCVADTIGDDCSSCFPNPPGMKHPHPPSDCADCLNNLLTTLDESVDMAEDEMDGCDENNCAKRAIGLWFVCMAESYPETDGIMQCLVSNAGDDCNTCACSVASTAADADYTPPDDCDFLYKRNKKTSRKNKKKMPNLF